MRSSLALGSVLATCAVAAALVVSSPPKVKAPVAQPTPPILPDDPPPPVTGSDDPSFQRVPRHAGPPEAPLALTASDGSGLKLAELKARTVLRGPLAFTELHLVFENPEPRVRQGTFRVALPPRANVARFAMKIDGRFQEGEVVEKERARRAYEDFLHRKQDPALLERGPGNDFSARVFPIPANGRKEIVLSYAEELPAGRPYTLPLRGLGTVGLLDIEARADGQAAKTLRDAHVRPEADFVYDPVTSAVVAVRSGELVAMRVEPAADVTPDPVVSAVVLVDTSASRALGMDAQIDLVADVLRGLGGKRHGALPVTVAAFDQNVEAVYRGDARQMSDESLAQLRRRGALGASNVERALRWAQDEAGRTHARRVVLVTDAVPTAGEEDAAKLADVVKALGGAGVERLDVVATGALRNDALAARLVTAGLPHAGVVAMADDGALAVARRLDGGTRESVAIDVPGARWSWPKRALGVQAGDDVVVFAEVPAGEPLRVRVGEGATRTIPAREAERPLLERGWAQAHVGELEDEERKQGKSVELRQRIVDFAVRYRVPSAYTSMVVLESEADYARFHIDRRALRDVLAVRDGRIESVGRPWESWPAKGNGSNRDGTAFPKPVASAPPQQPPWGSEESSGATLTGSAPGPAGGLGNIGGIGSGGGAASGFGARGVGSGGGGRARAAMDMDDMGPGAAPAAAPAPMPAAREEAEKKSADKADDMRMAEARPEPAAPPPPRARADMGEGAAASRAEAPATAAAPRPHGAATVGSRGFGIVTPDTEEAPRRRPRPPSDPSEVGVDPYSGKFKQVKTKLAHGDASGALALANEWHDTSPGDVLALVALGESCEATGDGERAARAYGSIIDLFPSRADLRRYAGARLEHLADHTGVDLALDTFEKARRDRPDHPASHRFVAYARLRKGDHAGAFEALVAALARRYPDGRFAGADRILREDLGLVAAAWMAADPSRRDEIARRVEDAGGTLESKPSLRFVLTWETDANDVDFHIYDGRGGHAFYSNRELPSGGELYADVTTGYGPECFTVRGARRAGPYKLRAHYYSRGPMGYGMGTLHVVEHDGHGKIKIEERPFVVMNDHAYVDLGTVSGG